MREFKSVRLNEMVYCWHTSTGLEVHFIPRPGYKKAYASITFHFGSNDLSFSLDGNEVRVPPGTAHFLEHKLFEEEDGNALMEFAALGANANAYTDHTLTSYLFSTTQNFEKCLATLLRFVQHPYITPESVQKEKGIIEQELRMYDDMPEVILNRRLLECLFWEHPVKIDIGGSVDSIQEIETSPLLTCHKAFYHPANAMLLVIGDFQPDWVERLVGEGIDDESPFAVTRKTITEPSQIKEHRRDSRMSVGIPLLAVAFKEQEAPASARLVLEHEVATRLALEVTLGRSSDLYQELYQEGLIDDTFNAGYEAQPDYGFSYVGCRSRDPEKLAGRLISALTDSAARSIEEKAILRAKKKLMGQLISLFNSPEGLAQVYNELHFKGVSIFDYFETLNELPIEKVRERVKEHFSRENCAVSMVLPVQHS